MILLDKGGYIMNDANKWNLVYYSSISHQLITVSNESLDAIFKMINDLVDTYGDGVEYQVYYGKRWI